MIVGLAGSLLTTHTSLALSPARSPPSPASGRRSGVAHEAAQKLQVAVQLPVGAWPAIAWKCAWMRAGSSSLS